MEYSNWALNQPSNINSIIKPRIVFICTEKQAKRRDFGTMYPAKVAVIQESTTVYPSVNCTNHKVGNKSDFQVPKYDSKDVKD